MIGKQLARPVFALGCIFLIAACADSVAPTAPSGDVSLAVQGQDRLAGWFTHASPAVLALPGAVFADHDERANKLVFGVENERAIAGVRVALARLGIRPPRTRWR
jgi:hypothetical protein